MSTILVVDKEPENIVNELKRFKGVNFFSTDKITDAILLLDQQQYDYILCEQALSSSHDKDNTPLFREVCQKSQPASEFYYLIPNDKIEESKIIKNEMLNADGVIRKPLKHNIIQLIVGSDLVDQTGIDELFEKLKSQS